eukprot:3736514-Rhodomonas_salina.1
MSHIPHRTSLIADCRLHITRRPLRVPECRTPPSTAQHTRKHRSQSRNGNAQVSSKPKQNGTTSASRRLLSGLTDLGANRVDLQGESI